MSTMATPVVIVSLIPVFYVLTLIKAYSILVYTYITWFVCPFASVVMGGKMEGSIRAQVFQSSSHQLIISVIAYNRL